jgi:hypothetical protein
MGDGYFSLLSAQLNDPRLESHLTIPEIKRISSHL